MGWPRPKSSSGDVPSTYGQATQGCRHREEHGAVILSTTGIIPGQSVMGALGSGANRAVFQVGLAVPALVSGSLSCATTPRATPLSALVRRTTSWAHWLSRCLGDFSAPFLCLCRCLGGTVSSDGGHIGTCFLLGGLCARQVSSHQSHGQVPAALEHFTVSVQRALVFVCHDGVLAHVPQLRTSSGPQRGKHGGSFIPPSQCSIV